MSQGLVPIIFSMTPDMILGRKLFLSLNGKFAFLMLIGLGLIGSGIVVESITDLPPKPVIAVAYHSNFEEDLLPSTLTSGQSFKHVVQPGENLSIIAKQYGIPWKRIADLNNLDDPDLLQVGQRLVVPIIQELNGLQNIVLNISKPSMISKEIRVKLDSQHIYAYENGQLVYDAQVSTGLPTTPTIRGEFAVYSKLLVQTMRGPDYDLPRVPFVLYFHETYSLHGTYWHNNFGEPMSHGCVNLSISDARWFYYWAEIGTPIVIEK